MPNPNISEGVIEAGGKLYGRGRTTDAFTEILSVDTSGNPKIGGSYPALAPSAGIKVVGGSTALGGSNPTAVSTGLTTVLYFVPDLQGTAAPGVGTSVLTVGAKSGGSVNVYAWKVTSNANPTLIASTGTETFDWVAVGT